MTRTNAPPTSNLRVALGLLGDAMNHGPSEPVFALIAEARDTIESALHAETPAECPGHYKVAARNVCTMFPHCLCSPEARAAEAAEDARHPKTTDARVANLLRALDAKQAKIDALMLEFCPAETSAELAQDFARAASLEHDGHGYTVWRIGGRQFVPLDEAQKVFASLAAKTPPVETPAEPFCEACQGFHPPCHAVQCQSCNGNDRDMPCAYPSEGKPGCLRDQRLAALDELVRLSEEMDGYEEPK